MVSTSPVSTMMAAGLVILESNKSAFCYSTAYTYSGNELSDLSLVTKTIGAQFVRLFFE